MNNGLFCGKITAIRQLGKRLIRMVAGNLGPDCPVRGAAPDQGERAENIRWNDGICSQSAMCSNGNLVAAKVQSSEKTT